MNATEYSIIIPIYDEERCVRPLLGELCAAMDGLGKPYEILVIDDGSTDRTWETVKELASKFPAVSGYRLNRNFGHQAAIYAGLKLAKGKAVGIMDGDGQDPPDVLVRLFQRWEEGYDVAYAVRRKRREGALKRLCYHGFYRLLSVLAKAPLPLDSGDFSVIDRGVAEFITSINDRTPYIRGLRSWYGGKQIAVEYDRRPRIGGKTKYSWFGLVDLALTGITSFSKVPLRLAIYMGGLMSLLSFCYAAFIVARRLLFSLPQHWGWSSVVFLVAFLGGFNLLILGFLGEYISHIFDSSKKFPIYLIRESTNECDPPAPST